MGHRVHRKWPRKPWHHLPDEALLAIPIGRLDLKWDETPLVAHEHQLRRELNAAGLQRFHPFVYLGDEWFSPVGVGAIAVPFFLADPRLRNLARGFFLDLEGGTKASFLRLLRHEAGHAFEHAYRLSELAGWRRLFGDPDKPYRSHAFRADPHTGQYVQHLDQTYAQAHPSEDFAETFAVLVTPKSAWCKRYAAQPGAYAKLTFVADLIDRLGSKPPRVREATLSFQAERMRRTVGEFFSSQREAQAVQAMERRLKLLFPTQGEGSAQDFLKEQKNRLFAHMGSTRSGASERASREYDQMVKHAKRLKLASPQDLELASLRLEAFLSDSLTH